MLNYYYTYSVIWGITLILYLFGWSGLNGKLNPILLIFFVTTIILSALLGRNARRRFHYKTSELYSVKWEIVLLLLVCSTIAFAQLGYIPVLDYFKSTVDYQRYRAADKSIFNTIAIVGSVFCVVLEYVVWIESRTRESLTKLLIFLGILFLFSSRGPFMICLYCIAIITASRFERKVTIGKFITTLSLLLIALVLFGAVGNIRMGYKWNDSSYIYVLGYYEGYWPKWLPRELCWAYSYITSPLANLNYALNYEVELDFINYIYDFLPMMLSKRLPLYIEPSVPLQVSYFTVSSVWSSYYLHLSYVGLFLGYILQMIILELLNIYADKTDPSLLMNTFSSECVLFSFFVNSFVYPTMGYPLIILLGLSAISDHSKNFRHHHNAGYINMESYNV